jgi:plastocyanin
MRIVRTFVATAAVILVAVGVMPPANAGIVNMLNVHDFVFNPATATIPLGTAADWTNTGPSTHQPAQDSPLSLWKVPPVMAGNTSNTVTLFAAGTFAYHCQIHPMMKGTIRVPVTTDITTGSVGDTITIGVASRAHPKFTINVQRRLGMGAWVTFKTGVTGLTVTFKATAAGSYQFRAKLIRPATHGASLFSPPATVTIS